MREYAMGELPREVAEKVKPRVRAVKVPPLMPVDTAHVKERYTLDDALRQAQMIRDAWAKAGHVVDARVEKYAVGGKHHYRVVVPGLVNGLPVRAVAAMRKDN